MKTSEILRLNAVANGLECPECGAREGIEWNGGRGVDCTYGCHGGNGCGEQWDAAEWRARVDDECAAEPEDDCREWDDGCMGGRDQFEEKF